jgi:recombinational DNA repair protein (RecF pathway)
MAKRNWYQRNMGELETCPICKKEFELGQMYEYRGAVACGDCIEEAREKRDAERAEVIAEQNHKTEKFKGLDLSDSTIGKANRQILKTDIEVAKKEGKRIRDYEGRD